jgi:hypothetical protein
MGIDILIEGCGWVEIVAQVRTRDLFRQTPLEKPEKLDTEDAEIKSGRLQSLDLLSEAEKREAVASRPTKGTQGTPDRLESLDLLSDDTAAEQAQEEPGESPGPAWPVVEVFSPNGKFIAARRPLNGWMLNKPKKTTTKSRPRPSMKGAKKREKGVRRQMTSTHED